MASLDPKTKIWSGPKVHREENNFTFQEAVLRCLNATPEKIFQVSEDEETSLTYSLLKTLTIRVAQNLQRFGMQQGDVIAVFFKNSTLVAPITLGSILNGNVVHPVINVHGINVEWIKKTFGATKPKIIIMEQCVESSELMLRTVREMELDCKIFIMNNDGKVDGENFFNVNELLNEMNDRENFRLPIIDDDALIFAIPSSGTTGDPKSIAMTGKYCKHLKYAWNNRDNVVVFTYSTISWFTGFLSLVFPLLNNGLRIITNRPFSTKSYGSLLKKFKVTTTVASTEAAILMSESPDLQASDYSGVKEFWCGGERVPSYVRESLESQLPKGAFGIIYGLSECGKISVYDQSVMTSMVDYNNVGKIAPNVQCKVIDLTSGEALGVNQLGEIFIKTETMFREYYAKPELTSKAFDVNGWYKSGDVGFFDNFGYLYVHGRAADMVAIQGKKIHPAQIESFFERIEGIRSACAFNILQEDILAVLCVKSSKSNVTEEFLALQAGKKFDSMEFRGGIHIVDEIPRTATNSRKIHKADVKSLALKLINLKPLQSSTMQKIL